MSVLPPFLRSISLRRCQLHDMSTRSDSVLWRCRPTIGHWSIESAPFAPSKRFFNQHFNAGAFHPRQTSRSRRTSWLLLGFGLSYGLALWELLQQRKVNEKNRRDIVALKAHLSQLTSVPAAMPSAPKDHIPVPLALEQLDHHGDPDRALQISDRLLEAIFMADRGGSFIPLTDGERQDILPRFQRARNQAERICRLPDKEARTEQIMKFARRIKTARDNGDKIEEALCVYKCLKAGSNYAFRMLDLSSDKQVRRYLHGLICLDESLAESGTKINGPMLEARWSINDAGGPSGGDLRAHLKLMDMQYKKGFSECAKMNALTCLDSIFVAQLAVASSLQSRGRDVPKALGFKVVASKILDGIPERLQIIDKWYGDDDTKHLSELIQSHHELLKQLLASFEV